MPAYDPNAPVVPHYPITVAPTVELSVWASTWHIGRVISATLDTGEVIRFRVIDKTTTSTRPYESGRLKDIKLEMIVDGVSERIEQILRSMFDELSAQIARLDLGPSSLTRTRFETTQFISIGTISDLGLVVNHELRIAVLSNIYAYESIGIITDLSVE